MAFDVQGALKAGYTMEEIGQHVKFDVAGAKSAGYSDDEIMTHLAGTKIAPDAPKPKETPGLATDLKNVGREFMEGISNPKPSYVRNQVDPVVLGPALNVAGQTGKAFGGALMAGGKAAVNALPDAITAPFKDMGTTVLKSLKGNPIVDAAVTAFNALPEESRTDWGNTANALNLIGLPPVARGTAAATKEGVNIARDLGTIMSTKTPVSLEKKLSSIVTPAIEKGIRPSVVGKRTAPKMDAYYDRAKDAVKTIVDNKNNLALTDAEGNVLKGELPKTLKQFSEAIDQTKRGIYDRYHAMATEAGESGATFNAKGIINKLDDVTRDLKYNPQVRKYADDLKAEIGELHGQPPEIIEARISDLNNSLAGYYEGRIGKAKAQVDGSVAKQMREELDNIIMNSSGPGYQDLKNQYGALKTLEKEVNHRAVVDARKNTKGLFDLSDVFTKGEILTGVLTMNPALIARGGAGLSIKNLYKSINNPDKIIQKMFSKSDDIINKAKLPAEIRSATGKSLMEKLSGLDDILARDIPAAVSIPRRPIARQNTMEVGPVLSGVLRGESYAPPQTLWKQKPRMLPAGQGFELKGRAYGPDVIDVPFRSNSKPILALPGEMQSPLRIPWQDFQLKGSPYQEGVLVGKPYGNVLRPIRPDPPIDAEFTSNIRRALPAPNTEGKFLLPQGQGFELVDRVAARPPEETLRIIQKQQPRDEFIGSNLRAARERMKARQKATEREAENLVTRIQQLGGITAGKDYNARILRQNPDAKRVLRNTGGKSPDEIASQLQAEGWQVESGDNVIELLKSGKGRTIYNPELQDKLFTRDIKRAENEWIERQLEKEGISVREVRENIPDYQARIIDDIGQEGIITEGKLDQALKEVHDFFEEMSGKAKQTVRDIKQSATDKFKDERGSFSVKKKGGDWKWWEGRDFQNEIESLPRKVGQDKPRNPIKEGYVPITRAEYDDLFKNKEEPQKEKRSLKRKLDALKRGDK